MGGLEVLFTVKCLVNKTVWTVTASWGCCFMPQYEVIRNVNKAQACAKTSKHHQVNIQWSCYNCFLFARHLFHLIPNSAPLHSHRFLTFPTQIPKAPAAPTPCGCIRKASHIHWAFLKDPRPPQSLPAQSSLSPGSELPSGYHISSTGKEEPQVPFIHSTNVYWSPTTFQAWFFDGGTLKDSMDLSLPLGRQLSKQEIGGTSRRAPYPCWCIQIFPESNRSDVTYRVRRKYLNQSSAHFFQVPYSPVIVWQSISKYFKLWGLYGIHCNSCSSTAVQKQPLAILKPMSMPMSQYNFIYGC